MGVVDFVLHLDPRATFRPMLGGILTLCTLGKIYGLDFVCFCIEINTFFGIINFLNSTIHMYPEHLVYPFMYIIYDLRVFKWHLSAIKFQLFQCHYHFVDHQDTS